MRETSVADLSVGDTSPDPEPFPPDVLVRQGGALCGRRWCFSNEMEDHDSFYRCPRCGWTITCEGLDRVERNRLRVISVAVLAIAWVGIFLTFWWGCSTVSAGTS